jgi:hypothetical protein
VTFVSKSRCGLCLSTHLVRASVLEALAVALVVP